MLLPMSVMWGLVVAATMSAVCHVRAEYRGRTWLVYAAKPLTTTLLIFAALAAPSPDPTYRRAIFVGLIFSLAGDVFLMLPKERFVLGLVSFLLAHIAYIVAFRTGEPSLGAPLILLPYVIVAVAVMAILWPGLGHLRTPVVVYVTALVIMAWLATERAAHLESPSAWAAAVGAALFVASDGALAVNKFRFRFAAAQAVVMSTYVIAQALIAVSISRSAG